MNAPSSGTQRRLSMRRFLAAESASAVLLVGLALIAIVWANSPWSDSYGALIGRHLGTVPGTRVTMNAVELLDDGLMALFFLVVGLEIKRELVEGELSTPRLAALPAVAALGGMVVPAAIFAILTRSTPFTSAWGIPMATDIALALGVATLLGRRVPAAAKVFLLALAIVDDLGAIVVIAVVYSSGIRVGYLAASLGCIVAVLALRRVRPDLTAGFVALGIVLWWCVLQAGIHATIAGVVMGFLTPVARIERIETALHPWTSLAIVPLFAFANAGVAIERSAFSGAGHAELALGVALGLVVGKPLGITAAVWIGRRCGLHLPDGMDLTMVASLGTVAGIGFTVSIFVADLALDRPDADAAKIAVMCASVVAALAGALTLSLRARREPVPR